MDLREAACSYDSQDNRVLSHQQPVIGWKGKSFPAGGLEMDMERVSISELISSGDMAGSGDVPRHLASRIRPHREGRSAGSFWRLCARGFWPGRAWPPAFSAWTTAGPVHRRPHPVLADDRLPRDRCPQRRGRLCVEPRPWSGSGPARLHHPAGLTAGYRRTTRLTRPWRNTEYRVISCQPQRPCSTAG